MKPRDELVERATTAFQEAFGRAPSHIIAAPGRVNLIGEHCDYNEGLVLPCAIDRETVIAIGEGDAELVRSVAVDFDHDEDAFAPQKPISHADEDWKNHIRGVAHFLRKEDVELRSANMAIAGNLPIGAGLSSSASLGVATALALSDWSDADLEPADLAHIAQRAENDFVGCACGVMDQMASACSEADAALLIDCQTMERRPVPIPDSLAITIIDSGVRRTLTDSPFNARRAECEAAARHYGVSALRDVDLERLTEERADLDETLFRRARHVVTEIARVKEATEALASTDLAKLADLMGTSHASLRDDFEVSNPPIDRLILTITEIIDGQGGVRMTGAGFGGCVVAITTLKVANDVVERVNGSPAESKANDGVTAAIYRPSKGAQRIR